MLMDSPPPSSDPWYLDLVDIYRGLRVARQEARAMRPDRDHHWRQDVFEALPTTIIVVFGVVCIALGFVAGIAFGYLLRGL